MGRASDGKIGRGKTRKTSRLPIPNRQVPIQSWVNNKEPWLAVNLSMFFPGVGQIYAGKHLKGLTFILIQAVLLAIAAWSVFGATGNTAIGLSCLIPIFITYIASLFDAYASVKRRRKLQTEKLPRKNKDPWFAVFLSRILPGLGQLYADKAIAGSFFLISTIIFSVFSSTFLGLLVFPPIICAFSSYHAYIAFPRSKRKSKPLIIATIAFLIVAFRLLGGYFPSLIEQGIEQFEIPSKSMVPTLQVGDRIFVSKSKNYIPQQGDLIVFKEPAAAKTLDPDKSDKEQYFIKRVIGKPGEVVQVTDGVVYINNQPLSEAYIADSPAYQWGPVTVPADSYIVLGDNRNNSFDSHIWGFLPKHQIVGQAYKIFWPPDRIGPLVSSS